MAWCTSRGRVGRVVCVDPGEMPLVDEGGGGGGQRSKARHVRRVVEDPEAQEILRDEVREGDDGDPGVV